MTFGAKLRTERLRLRMTLAQVAKRSGMSTQRLAEVETSKSASTAPKHVIRLALVLRIDPLGLLRMAKPDDYYAWKKAFGWSAPKRKAASK